MNTLSHNLLHSSARFAPYLSESSTRGYLALIDDAVVSHNSGVEMEVVSHHELRRIMKGEIRFDFFFSIFLFLMNPLADSFNRRR